MTSFKRTMGVVADTPATKTRDYYGAWFPVEKTREADDAAVDISLPTKRQRMSDKIQKNDLRQKNNKGAS